MIKRLLLINILILSTSIFAFAIEKAPPRDYLVDAYIEHALYAKQTGSEKHRDVATILNFVIENYENDDVLRALAEMVTGE
jgi:hypothetical protein